MTEERGTGGNRGGTFAGRRRSRRERSRDLRDHRRRDGGPPPSGSGFLEAVYGEALALEFGVRGIPARREVYLPIQYKGRRLTCGYRADFVCYGCVIVELKALAGLTGREQSQVLNYLKATGLSRGLLLNFGTPRLEYKRLILSNSYLRPSADEPL